MAFRDAAVFRDGGYLFQHGQHLKDVSDILFGGIFCPFKLVSSRVFSPQSPAALVQITPIFILHLRRRFSPCFISPLAPNGVPSVGMLATVGFGHY